MLRHALRTTLCWAALWGCTDGPYDPPSIPEVALSISSGDGQVAAAGSWLPQPLLVHATDRLGRPVRGVTIHWHLSDPGATGVEDSLTSVTDAAGLARLRRRVGSIAGEYITTASPAGAPDRTIRFRSIALVQGAARIGLHPEEPTGRTDTVLAAFAARVLVRDHLDRPVPRVRVSWETRGSARWHSGTATSDEHGVARVPVTLGSATGAYHFRAWVAGLEGSPVMFAGTAVHATPTRIDIVSGDGQYGFEHSAVLPYVVRVTDAHGNPVGGTPVRWRVVSGGGSIVPAQATTVAEMVAGAPRVAASATHTLGSPVEPQVVTATAVVEGAPSVTFTSTAMPRAFPPVAAPAVAYERLAPHAYDAGPTFSRYVLLDDRTFSLQFLRPDLRFFEYRGRYTRADTLITFDFDDSSPNPWQAVGVVHGDSMVVAYNLSAAMSDFEDAVYVRRFP